MLSAINSTDSVETVPVGRPPSCWDGMPLGVLCVLAGDGGGGVSPCGGSHGSAGGVGVLNDVASS